MFSSDLVKLADFHLTACVLLAVSFVAGAVVGQPAKRLALAWATVAGLVGLFVLTLIPGWSCWSLTDPVPAPTPDATAPIVVAPAEPRAQPPIGAQPIASPPIDAGRPVVAVRQPAEPPGFDYSLFTALVVAWCVPAAYWIGVIVSAMWLLIGWLFARRLVYQASEVDGAAVDLLRDLTEQPPRLLVSDRVGGPVAIGLLRPTILLPRRLVDESDNAELRTVLAHELAHVRGRDLWLLAALRTLLVALWCNPLFWALRRRVRLDQETLADAAAAELSDRHGYAERLLGWARAMAPQPRLAGSAGLWESPSQLRRRIAVLLDEGFTVLRQSSLRWRAACGVACSALAVAASLVTLGAAEPAANADAPVAEQSDGLTYSGVVVGKQSGEPIEGAEVRVWIKSSRVSPWPTLSESTYQSDARGRYEFAITPEQSKDSHLYIEVQVTHESHAGYGPAGYALSMIRKNREMGEEPFFARLELEPAEVVSGVLLTPDGAPAVGVKVLGYSKAKPHDLREHGAFIHEETDVEGRFRLNTAAGGHSVLWFLPGDFAPETHVLEGRKGDLGEFTLSRGVELSGRVLGAFSKPVAGVWVNAELTGGPAKKQIAMPVSDAIERSALTDDEGRYAMAPLPEGTYKVLPEERPSDGLVDDRAPRPFAETFLPTTFNLAEGQRTLDFEASEPVTIRAQTFGSNGKPRQGHGFDFVGRVNEDGSGFYSRHVEPDEEGVAEVRVPKGLKRAELFFSTNEHGALRIRLAPGEPLIGKKWFNLGTLEKDYDQIEIVRYKAPILLIEATDENGKRLDDLTVSVVYKDPALAKEKGMRYFGAGEESNVGFEKQQDARWRSKQLLPDEPFELRVSAGGKELLRQEMQLVEGEVRELKAGAEKAAAGAPIAGKVVYAETGDPAVGAEVRLLAWPEGAYRYDTKTTRSGPDGAFRFDDYPEGKLKLAAYVDGFASRSKRYQGHDADPGEEEIRLELREAPSLKVVVVEDANGRPVSGATVRLTWTDGKRDHTTDTEGAVTIAGLTPETWTIEVQAAGYAEDEQAITLPAAGVTTVTSKLSPGAAVQGRLLAEDGSPIAGAGVSVFREGMRGGQIEYMKTGADGRFRFDFLPEGRLLFMLSGDGHEDKQVLVTTRAGQDRAQAVDFTLAKRPDGGSVVGVVVDASGEPIAGAKVTNNGRSSDDLRETTTDEKGRFRLDNVYRGSQGHELYVKAKGHVAQAVPFKPGDPANPTELRVELPAGQRIKGRVVNEAGDPLNGVRIYYANGNRFPGIYLGGQATTGADGRFEFTSCPEGCPFAFVKDGYSEINDRKLPLNRAEDVVVTLLDEGVIFGKVVDATTGEPVTPYTVHVTFSPDRKPGDPSPAIRGNRATGLGERHANRDGRFLMDDLTRAAPLQVTVEAEGYRRALKRRVEPGKKSEATEVVFEMTPLAAIELGRVAGKVVGSDGAPVPGVSLRLIVADGELPRHNRFPFNWEMIQARGGYGLERSAAVTQFLSAVSDREGRFSFEQVEPGKKVQIAYWGEGVARGRVQGLERLSSEKQADLMISAAPGATVMGTVDKHAFPDLSDVLLMGPEGSLYSGYRAGDTGFEIRNVPAGKYELQAYRSERDPENPQYYQTEVVKRVSFEVKSGEVVEVTVGAEQAVGESPAPPAGKVQAADKATFLPVPPDYPTTAPGKPNTVAGLCLDESGETLAGVEVLLLHRRTSSSPVDQVARMQTGADGRFRFSDVISDPESVKPRRMPTISDLYQVVAKRAGYVSRAVAQEPSQIALRGANIAFRLPPAGELAGRVTDANGAPVEGARVRAEFGGRADLGDLSSYTALTDSEGRYAIKDLPVGDYAAQRKKQEQATKASGQNSWFGVVVFYDVTVTHPGHAIAKQPLDRVPGELDIALAPAAVVEGRLVHEDGNPFDRLVVRLEPDLRSNQPKDVSPVVLISPVEPDGRYRFDSSPAGDYYLRVDDRYDSDLVSLLGQKVRAVVGEPTVVPDLALSNGRIVEFQLVDSETGEPLSFDTPMTGVGWYFLSESDNAYGGSPTREAEIGADGRFSYRVDNRAVRMGIDLPLQAPGLYAEHPQFRVEVPAGQVEQPFPFPIDRSRVRKLAESPGAVLNDALRLVAEGKVEEAIDKLSALLDKQAPTDPNLLWKRGDFYGMAQQPAEAIADYEAALALKPDFAFIVKNNLAHLLATVEDTGIRDPQRAVQLAREAIAEAPRPMAQIHDTLATALLAAGDTAGSIAALEQAVAVANDLEKPDLTEKLEKLRDR